METIKMVWKSKRNICPCSPPRILHVHQYDDRTRETTHIILGNQSLNCPYCGNPWKDHK